MWRDARDAELDAADTSQLTPAQALSSRLQHQLLAPVVESFELTGDDETRQQFLHHLQLVDSGHSTGVLPPLNERFIEWALERKAIVDEAKRFRKETDPDLAAEAVVREYLARTLRRIEARELKPTGYETLRSSLNTFLDYFGRSRSIEDVDERVFAAYVDHLRQRDISATTANNYLGRWKTFLRRTFDNHDLQLPRNFDSSEHRIERGGVTPQAFTPDEVALIFEAAPPSLQLPLHLMLNCSMTQKEVSDLRGENVDWDRGRVLWARKKTEKSSPPTVNYALWDATWTLLSAQGHRTGPLVRKQDGTELITFSQTPDTKSGGTKIRKADSVKSNWAHLVRRLKRDHFGDAWKKTLKTFRKTLPSLYETSDHAEFIDMQLDHKRIAKRHYVIDGQIVPKFDEAVVWAGEQFGLMTDRGRIDA